MKLSFEASDNNKIIITELLEKWKEHEKNMNKESALEYIEKLQQPKTNQQSLAA